MIASEVITASAGRPDCDVRAQGLGLRFLLQRRQQRGSSEADAAVQPSHNHVLPNLRAYAAGAVGATAWLSTLKKTYVDNVSARRVGMGFERGGAKRKRG